MENDPVGLGLHVYSPSIEGSEKNAPSLAIYAISTNI